MSAIVREATAADRDLFLKLWREYIAELGTLGGEVLPTQRTMDFFARFFDWYVSGELPGVALLLEDFGVLMCGAMAKEPLYDSTFDPMAHGWGTYIQPDHRGKGYSRVLREAGVAAMKHAGFKAVVGGSHTKNDVSQASLLSFGGRVYQLGFVLYLGGEHGD
jgi:GNAT superfamily N-acetyltransferase